MHSKSNLINTKNTDHSLLSRLFSYLSTGWRYRVLTFLFLGISLVAIGSILNANWSSIKSYILQLNPIWLLISLVLISLDILLITFVWHVVVVRMTYYNNLRRNVKHWLYSNMAKRLPGPVWYIANRVMLYEQDGVSKINISVLSGLELALILVSGVITFMLTLPFWSLSANIWGQIGRSWPLLLLLTGSIVLVHPTVLTKLWQRLSQETVQPLYWKETGLWCGFYVLIWIIGGCALYAIINIFFVLPIQNIFAVIGMWAIANIISLAGTLALSGMGLRELSLVLLLTQILPPPAALFIAIISRLLWLTTESLLAILSLLL